VIERTDPAAVIQTRGSRVVQADALGESLRVVADRQDTYRDGGLRLVDNVRVTMADRGDRAGFVLAGNEATLDASKTAVELTGDVEMESSDGLSASTDYASYSDHDGVVQMPGPTTFRRDGMDAAGDSARYDRENDILRLLRNAQVDLTTDTSSTRILSQAATLAQSDLYMEFSDDVNIETDNERMAAGRARATLQNTGTTVESLNLMRDARIVGIAPQPGNLREMTARAIGLVYDDAGVGLETAMLTGGSQLEMEGVNGSAGSTIHGRSIQVVFATDGVQVTELVARTGVVLTLSTPLNEVAQTISADSLTVTRQNDDEPEQARFDGDVTFQEVSLDENGLQVSMITHADRLDCTLTDEMTKIGETRFLGNVTFENGDVVGVTDEAIYGLGGRVELITSEGGGRTPRVNDRRGSVQASVIALGVNESEIIAEGEVESVLVTDPAEVETEDRARRPSLLEPSEPTYVTAGRLVYGGATGRAVYSQGARLWQAATEFVADTIVLDEDNGNINATGGVRTRSMISQVNNETGLQEESINTGKANEFMFDDSVHQAIYTTDASLLGPRGDLTADQISLFLMPDGRTLERIEATGHVELAMPGRSITGESLVYHDAEGRYEMEGGPVHVIEEIDAQCRETTGRTLTFFLTDDAVSVDGESEVRTETLRGICPALVP
jgi:LPS export ABC transporter protein LptC